MINLTTSQGANLTGITANTQQLTLATEKTQNTEQNTKNAKQTSKKGNKTMITKNLNVPSSPLEGANILKNILGDMDARNSNYITTEEFNQIITEVFPEFLDTDICDDIKRYNNYFDYAAYFSETSEKEFLQALIRINNTTALTEEYFLNILDSLVPEFTVLYRFGCDTPVVTEIDAEDFFNDYVIDCSEDPDAVRNFCNSLFYTVHYSDLVRWMFTESDWRMESYYTYDPETETVLIDEYDLY